MKKILIHDYCGHPFQFDLSVELAKRGYQVLHVYTDASQGPKADFISMHIDTLKVFNIKHEKIRKYRFIQRWFQEVDYGNKLKALISSLKPDIIISANTPLAAQIQIVKRAKKNNIPFIFWLQDIISIAAKLLLKNRNNLLTPFVGLFFQNIEKNALQNSSHIIAISEDFKEILLKWKVPETHISIIPNWAPLKQIPVLPKVNNFSRKHHIDTKFVIMYSGTIGMKHNPHFIISAAEALYDQKEIVFLVISEGIGIDNLRAEVLEKGLQNIMFMPFQPFQLFPQVLASADIFLVILNPEAGIFSVPSKVWSGFCAKRPTLLIAPEENQAAKVIRKINAGYVISNNNIHDFIEKIHYIRSNPEEYDAMALNARQYAEDNFEINQIANQFENIINQSMQNLNQHQ